jgi:hypothetical protein
MIYEVRTYDLKPGTIPKAEEAFAEALPHRQKYSPLAAFWHTEIGPLNQIIHVWGYENLEERDRIRAEANNDPNWPPKVGEYLVNMNSEVWIPAPFMRPLGGDQALGAIYEMRTYTYQPGSIPELLRRWGDSIPHREKLSPLAAGMYTEFGDLNRWMHIWPYKDLAQRAQIRAESRNLAQWPPGTPGLVSQENKIMIPAAFSPMH